jgi:hypothetical protein
MENEHVVKFDLEQNEIKKRPQMMATDFIVFVY